MPSGVENDAWLPAPDIAAIERHAERFAEPFEMAAEELVRQRGKAIAMMRADPYRFGFEPDIWLVARAMMGMTADKVPEVRRIMLAERTGKSVERAWDWWREELCSRMGLAGPCMEMMLLGGNASGKTDFAAKVCNEVARDGTSRKIMVGSQKWEKSIEVQQARVWNYTPAEEKRSVTTDGEYVRYREKTGYSGNSAIVRGGCRIGFVFYTQRQDDVFEGGKENFCWFDEEYPLEWVLTARYRVARVMGRMLKTFTPISGYTPAVGDDLDGMRVIRNCQGYMLPNDGGAPRPDLALGLTREELERLGAWMDEWKRNGPVNTLPQTVPSSRPEDCVGWVTRPWEACEPNAAPGREWEQVPRAAVSGDGKRGILWFHGRDNPYGNPLENISKALENPAARNEIRTRVYGMAIRRVGRRFAAFDAKVHVKEGDGNEG